MDTQGWDYAPGNREIPIIIPRNYLNLYNYGFAKIAGPTPDFGGYFPSVQPRYRHHGQRPHGTVQGAHRRALEPAEHDPCPRSLHPLVERALRIGRRAEATRTGDRRNRRARSMRPPGSTSHRKDTKPRGRLRSRTRQPFCCGSPRAARVPVGLLFSAMSFYVLLLSIFLLLQKNSDKRAACCCSDIHPTAWRGRTNC